jgi:hypothetical protein
VTIIDAIRLAHTEHIVYFLLTAYVETLEHYDSVRSSLPARVKRLPMAGKKDVVERLRALRDARVTRAQRATKVRAVIQEACEVFSAGLERLSTLQEPDDRINDGAH